MKPKQHAGWGFRVLIATLTWLLTWGAAQAATNVYSTRFETTEGYNPNSDLAGQLGWTSAGSGGNGFVTNFIAGEGQHAYLGFTPPDTADQDQLIVWKPVNFDPIASHQPLVTFTVQLQISDSANTNYDYFRWSFYNIQGDRLFSIEFDNYVLGINYLLSKTNEYFPTPVEFSNAVTYALTVSMNFASNRWSASLNSTAIATNQLITTSGAPLNLGDVDAVWFIFDPELPGDNFMVFDNYQITAQALTSPPSKMQFLGRTVEGWSLLRVTGADNSRWSVDTTTNLTQWTPLRTNTVSGTSFDYVDMTAPGVPRRFYRARFVP